ncbi:MAG: ExbD/TolR family protein [Planctomycetota bacterium]
MQATRENLQKALHERLSAGKKRSFSIRMTAMIDMVFLLLIFFLVTAKWRPPEHFLPLKLPAAKALEQKIGRAEPLVIRISEISGGCLIQLGQDENVQIQNETIESDLALLLDRVNAYLIAKRRYASDPIEIICTPAVKWDYIAKVYNMFYGAGLTDITFEMTELDKDDSVK